MKLGNFNIVILHLPLKSTMLISAKLNSLTASACARWWETTFSHCFYLCA